MSTIAMGSTVRLADAPPIRGLRFRHYAGATDHPAMVRVNNAVAEADKDDEVATVAGMDVDYANLSNSDPFRDALLAEVDGDLVAYSRVEWEDDNSGGRSYNCFGFVHPEWRRRGIGRSMLHHDEARLREICAEHPHDRPRWLASWGNDTNSGNSRLLTSEGYVAVRHFYEMIRADLEDIAEAPMPDGLEIRPMKEEHMRALFAADVEAFRDHWGGVDGTENSFQRWVKSPDFDPSLYLVAWQGDQIAGAVLNGIYPVENERHGFQRGWLDSVFTRRAWRQRGLARALIARSFVLLKERGMTSAALGVDATNPHEALRLYKESGFAIGHSATAYRKPRDAVIGPEWS